MGFTGLFVCDILRLAFVMSCVLDSLRGAPTFIMMFSKYNWCQ